MLLHLRVNFFQGKTNRIKLLHWEPGGMVIYSKLLEAGIEPRVWMEDVLKQIPYYLRDGRDLAELLPRAWASRNQL